METITSGGSFKLKGFVLWFLFFFPCHDPQFLEEVVRFSKSHSKFWRIFFLLEAFFWLFYGEPCLLVDGKF